MSKWHNPYKSQKFFYQIIDETEKLIMLEIRITVRQGDLTLEVRASLRRQR